MKTIKDFDQNFASFLETDEFGAVESLLIAFQDIAGEFIEILSDENIKLYQKSHPETYTFKISLSTIRSYLHKKIILLDRVHLIL